MWDGGPQTLHRAQARGLKMWTSQDGGKGPKPTHANSRPSTRLQPCRRCIRASEGIVSNKFPIAPVGQRQSSQRIDCETHTAHDRFLTQFSNSCRSMRCRLHHWPTARQSTAQNHRWGSLTTRTIGQKGGGGCKRSRREDYLHHVVGAQSSCYPTLLACFQWSTFLSIQFVLAAELAPGGLGTTESTASDGWREGSQGHGTGSAARCKQICSQSATGCTIHSNA